MAMLKGIRVCWPLNEDLQEDSIFNPSSSASSSQSPSSSISASSSASQSPSASESASSSASQSPSASESASSSASQSPSASLSPSASPSASPSVPDNAVAYWPMEEASGDRLDSIGSNDLTPSGGDTQVSGKVGNAVRVAAAFPANKLEKAVTSGLTTTGDYTFAAWLYIGSGPSAEDYIKLHDSGGAVDLFRLGRSFSGSSSNRIGRFFHRDSGGEKFVFAGDTANYFPLDTWVLFVATYDSTADELTLETGWSSWPQNYGTTTSVGSMVSPSGDVRLTFQGSGFGSNVQYDEVGLWHEILTTQDKENIFVGVTL